MPGMVPEDIHELTGATDPRLSPDGRTVAYVVASVDREGNEYRSAIWLLPSDGSGEPTQLTSGLKRDASPRWSPDGSLLAFTSNRAGDTAQLYVIPVTGGEPRKLTDLKEDAADPVWSPDGERIAFASRTPDPAYDEKDDRKRPPRRFTRLMFKLDHVGWTGDRRSHLFVVAADGSSKPVQLTDGDFEDEHPCWSPDGERIAFTSARDDDWDTRPVRDIYVVDADGGEPTKLTPSLGDASFPSWSPGGNRIAYLFKPGVFDDPRHSQVAVLDLATNDRSVLTEDLDRNCAPYPPVREPVWDGEDLLFALEDAGNQPLYRVPADGSGKPELVIGGECQVSGWDAIAGRIANTRSSPTEQAELYLGDRRATRVGAAFTDARELSAPERFTATSADGTEVEAWVMPPSGLRDGERYPMLFNIHGGPFAQHGNRFFDEFHVYTGAGYAVVYSNPRGSSGYAEDWARAIRGPVEGGPGWGTRDYEDCMAVVDEAVSRYGFIDPERVGVMGGSYGGFMTSWIAGHTDRFRAACSERSCNNFLLEGGSADIGWMFKGETGAFWFEAPEAYLKISPSTYAPNITTPLLIVHSESDHRCPVGHAEDLFAILRLLGREVEMVRFPEEGHELSRSGSPIHRVQRFQIILDWFDRHLKT